VDGFAGTNELRRFTVYGSRFTVHGLRLTAYGLRFSVYGSRFTGAAVDETGRAWVVRRLGRPGRLASALANGTCTFSDRRGRYSVGRGSVGDRQNHEAAWPVSRVPVERARGMDVEEERYHIRSCDRPPRRHRRANGGRGEGSGCVVLGPVFVGNGEAPTGAAQSGEAGESGAAAGGGAGGVGGGASCAGGERSRGGGLTGRSGRGSTRRHSRRRGPGRCPGWRRRRSSLDGRRGERR
jgi:hypothetical protein